MGKIVCFFCTACFSFFAFAQQPELEWAHSFQGGENVPQFIESDEYGNVYTVGYFTWQSVDFDPGSGVQEMEATDDRDVYISKLDKDGNFIWCRRFGGGSDDYPTAVSRDNDNNIYISGNCWNICTYGDGQSEDTIFSTFVPRFFLIKITKDGDLALSKEFGFSALGLDVDVHGNIYSTGYFAYTSDFDPGPDEYLITTDYIGFFIHKLDADGDFQWVRTYDGDHAFYGKALQCDKNNDIIIGGFYREPIDFDPGPDTVLLTPSVENSQEGVILKMDGGGNLIWAYTIVGELSNINALNTDHENNILISGTFKGIIDFDYSENDSIISSGTGFNPFVYDERNFLLKLSEMGTFEWVRAFPKMAYTKIGLITVDNLNAVYYSSAFSSLADINPEDESTLGVSNGWADAYVTKLSKDGSFEWGIFYGGVEHEAPRSIFSGQDGALYVTGNFNDSCDFDPGSNNYALYTPPFHDNTYIQKFASTLGIEDMQSVHGSLIYPNPTTGLVFLKADYPASFGSVRNSQGQELAVPNHGNQLDLSRFPAGVYFVTILLEERKEKVERVVLY